MMIAARILNAVMALMALLVAGCAALAPAPVDDRRPAPVAQPMPPVLQPTGTVGAAPAASAVRAGTYTVKRGDTLYSIALEHGADYRELAQWNKLEDPSRIRVGQELRTTAPEDRAQGQEQVQVRGARLPGEVESRPLGAGSLPPPSAAAQDGSMKTGPRALRLPYSEQNLAMLSKGEARAEPVKPVAPAAASSPSGPAPASAATGERAADAIEFIWPVKGRVLAGFSEPRNKGLDIAGSPGDPVVAAAPGRVIYAGAGIPGLGKFIVVRHENGFNTVYAHNREILVKMDQNLTRGQKIAELGSTDADAPKLHFQIRKFGTPLDPMKFLPPS
jgi:lipoprotein NlpD